MPEIPMATVGVEVERQSNGWTVSITQRPDPDAWRAHQKSLADAKEQALKVGAEAFFGGLMKNMAGHDPVYQDAPAGISWPTMPSVAGVDVNIDMRPTTRRIYVFERKDDLIAFLAETI